MGQYLTNTFGSPELEYNVTSSNYMDVYDKISNEQGLIHMIPSDPVAWDAAGHVDVFGTYMGTFDLRNSGHMIKYLSTIAGKPGHPPGKIRIWRLEGTLPQPHPKPVKKGFWDWLKGLFN